MTPDLSLPIPDLLAGLAPRVNARIEAMLPRILDAGTLARLLGPARYAFDADSLTQALARPVWHVLDAGGKRWRPGLMILSGLALGVQPEALLDLAAMVEMIHNGTLMVDDIEDDSPRRRGRDAAHVAFGVDLAINAGNMLYFLPAAAAIRSGRAMPEATRLGILRTVIEEMARLHAGQAMDIAWHRGLRLPDADQYLQMCALKTGTMARMAVRIAAEVAGVASAGDALGRYAESLGVAFQIQDDILNVTPSALSEGKGFGDDIHEGKITLLVIHALERSVAPTRDRLIEILRSHTSDPSRLREAADILATSGALDFGRRTASRLVREAWTEAQAVLPDNAATRKLREFGEYLTTRNV